MEIVKREADRTSVARQESQQRKRVHLICMPASVVRL